MVSLTGFLITARCFVSLSLFPRTRAPTLIAATADGLFRGTVALSASSEGLGAAGLSQLELSPEIPPLGMPVLDQLHLPCPVPFLQLFLSCDGRWEIRVEL
jgi:hypothetical protein